MMSWGNRTGVYKASFWNFKTISSPWNDAFAKQKQNLESMKVKRNEIFILPNIIPFIFLIDLFGW